MKANLSYQRKTMKHFLGIVDSFNIVESKN